MTPPAHLTPEQQTEWRYRYEERLGTSCEGREPDASMSKRADAEASAAVQSTCEKIGFTGTQRGTTEAQRKTLSELIERTRPAEFHHGDCIGADAEAHDICDLQSKALIVIHPPSNETKRAFKKSKYEPCLIKAARPYLDRNKDIVDATDALIACPGEDREQQFSGTWSTVRYARRQRKPIYIILPDGTIL